MSHIHKKTVYFVRHGESVTNAQDIRQGSTEPLSPLGHTQAVQVGRYIQKLNPDIIYTSTYKRAEETTEHIAKACNMSYKATPLLGEKKNPTSIIGLPTKSPKALEIATALDKALTTKTGRYEDAENFEDLNKRSESLYKLLEGQDGGVIVCVTHWKFLRFFHSYILYKEKLTPEIFDREFHSLVLANTGIVEYETNYQWTPEREPTWVLKQWNNTQHLKD